MSDLPPAARAVYDAYCKEADNPYYYVSGRNWSWL
jgi:hypothetical protein